MCCHHWQGKKNNRMFHKAPAYSKNPKGTEHYELQTVPTHLVAGQHHTTRGGQSLACIFSMKLSRPISKKKLAGFEVMKTLSIYPKMELLN